LADRTNIGARKTLTNVEKYSCRTLGQKCIFSIFLRFFGKS
jgi:hypothetical protein